MELIGQDKCPFDWKGDTPPSELRGGEIIEETALVFAYGFFNASHRLAHVLVVCKEHVEDLGVFFHGELWKQTGEIWFRVLTRTDLAAEGVNLSYNFGFDAGQRLKDIHGHGVTRTGNTPSGGKGLKLATERFDALVYALQKLMPDCPDAIRGQLLQLIEEATRLK